MTPAWDRYALLVVDAQHDFWPDDVAAAAPEMPERLAWLLAFAREHGVRVVHLRAEFRPDGSDWMARYRLRGSIPCIAGTPGASTLAWAAEQPGETVIRKQSFDGFLGTDLDATLRAAGVRFLMIAGLITSTCVLLTAATATQLGYLVSVVSDCCADLPAAHRVTLDGYRFIFDPVRTDEIVDRRPEWDEQLARL
jgi:nicotinamidase-related amidase